MRSSIHVVSEGNKELTGRFREVVNFVFLHVVGHHDANDEGGIERQRRVGIGRMFFFGFVKVDDGRGKSWDVGRCCQ